MMSGQALYGLSGTGGKATVKKKSARTLLLLFTMIFAVSSFGTTAWAESGGGNITAVPSTSEGTGKTSTPEVVTSSEQPPVSSKEGPATSSKEETSQKSEPSVSKNPGGGTEVNSDQNNNNGGGSTGGGTGTSSKTQSANRGSNYVDPDAIISEKGNASVEQNPNTHENHINQNASALVSATPNAQSEDWSNLMPSSAASSGVSSVTVSMAAGGATAVTSGKNGGLSSLFLLGVGLIVAAACGIGAFIYLQFFSRKNHGGPKDYRSDDDYENDADGFTYDTAELEHMDVGRNDYRTPVRSNATAPAEAEVVHAAHPAAVPHRDDTIDNFTDINSSSDGIQHREEYEEFVERTKPPIMSKPASRTAPPIFTPPKADEETLVLPQIPTEEAARRAHQMQTRKHHPPLTSNAVPRNLRGRPAAVQTVSAPPVSAAPVVQPSAPRPVQKARPSVSARPKPSTVSQPAVSVPHQASAAVRPAPKKTQNHHSGDDFNWDKFFDENRHN